MDELKWRLKAFTLIELLVVIGIISILAAMLMPALGAARQRAREAAAKADIQAISVAMEQFADDFNQYPPDEVDLTVATDDFGYSGTLSDTTGVDREVESGWAIVFYLSEGLETRAGTSVGPYLEFEASRIQRDDPDDNYFVYMNPFGSGHYRFRNNDEGDSIATDNVTWNDAVTNWDVSYVNRSSLDIWTDDGDGEDFVDLFAGETSDADGIIIDDIPIPTWSSLRGEDDIQDRYQTISNW